VRLRGDVVSTRLYLECLDHDPPLRAEGESGQHLYDLPDIRKAIANRPRYVRLLAEDPEAMWALRQVSGHLLANSMSFLLEHPRCLIGIRDEYGHPHPVEAPE
jgi:hypothetical protein